MKKVKESPMYIIIYNDERGNQYRAAVGAENAQAAVDYLRKSENDVSVIVAVARVVSNWK